MPATAAQLALLNRTERVSLAWCDLVNGHPLLNGLAHPFLRAEITRLGRLERALPRPPRPGYDGPCRGPVVPEPPG